MITIYTLQIIENEEFMFWYGFKIKQIPNSANELVSFPFERKRCRVVNAPSCYYNEMNDKSCRLSRQTEMEVNWNNTPLCVASLSLKGDLYSTCSIYIPDIDVMMLFIRIFVYLRHDYGYIANVAKAFK